MAKFILVACPDPAFRETLRASLTDSGGYNVQLANNGAEVLASIGNLAFDIAILDSEISDFPLTALVDAVRLKLPDAKILVVPPTDLFSALSLKECGADGFINKPFYVPELLEIIQKLFSGQTHQEELEIEMPFQKEVPAVMRDIFSEELAKVEWPSDEPTGDDTTGSSSTLILPLQDIFPTRQPKPSDNLDTPGEAETIKEIPPAQFLEMEELAKWFSESTARTAMLINGIEITASSGEFEADAAKKLIDDIQARFKTSAARELIRYIPAQRGLGDQLLYASVLGADKYIVLTYEANASYSLIRQQADRLRKRLTETEESDQLIPDEVSQAWSKEGSGDWIDPNQDDQSIPGEIPVDMQTIPADSFNQTGKEPVEVQDTGFTVTPTDAHDTIETAEIVSTGSSELPLGDLNPVIESQTQTEAGNPDENLPVIAAVPEPSIDKPDGDDYPWLADGLGVTAAAVAEQDLSPLPEGLASAFPWGEETSEISEEREPETDTAIDKPPSDADQVERFEDVGAPIPEIEESSLRSDAEIAERITKVDLANNTPPLEKNGDMRVFILVPADPRVFLTGKLAGELGAWIPQVCQTMNWEVDALAVRPEFIRIGLIASPDQTDKIIVSTLQDATARLVASNYSQMVLDPENPSFWADDFLKINPHDPPDQNVLNAFIRHLRR